MNKMKNRLISGKTKKIYPIEIVGGKGQGLIRLKGLEKKIYSYDFKNRIVSLEKV